MFGKGITLFRLLGIPVAIDVSWPLLVLLVMWTLATGVFPGLAPGLAPAAYWLMAAAGTFGLFLSIVLHELAHAVVARKHGIPIAGITLFIFGGVAEMKEEPPGPRSEFLVAIAGPLLSVALGLAFLAAESAGQAAGVPVATCRVLGYLGWMNVVLAVFNMVPGFPLDGGRVLRAMLWAWKHDLVNATRVATAIGSSFAFTLIVLGGLQFLLGNLVGGVWVIMSGLFLHGAAQSSYQHALLRHALDGEPISRFMTADPVTVGPEITVRELVDDYFYRHHFQSFPVVEDGRFLGCVSTDEVKVIPRAEWSLRTVGEILTPCDRLRSVGPEATAMQVFAAMTGQRLGRLLVVDHGRFVGLVTLGDLLRFVAVKLDIAETDREPVPQRPPPVPVVWPGRPAGRGGPLP